MEIAKLNFKECNVFSGLKLETVLVTLVSKIVCGRVTWFQLEKCRLVYRINVRE